MDKLFTAISVAGRGRAPSTPGPPIPPAAAPPSLVLPAPGAGRGAARTAKSVIIPVLAPTPAPLALHLVLESRGVLLHALPLKRATTLKSLQQHLRQESCIGRLQDLLPLHPVRPRLPVVQARLR